MPQSATIRYTPSSTMSPPTNERANLRERRWIALPWLVLAIGMSASVLLFTGIRDTVENVARLRFERQAIDAKATIEHRVNFYADILYGLKALFASQSPVSRVQFHDFVRSLDLKHRYPGFDVVNYAVHVPGADKARFEDAVRRDKSLDPNGYPHFAIKPPGDRPEYHVVVYVEPMAGFDFALGLDLGANPAVAGADPSRLTALQRAARDSGQLTASGRPIRVKAAKEYVGLAMRLAVYRNGMPIRSVEQRRAAYLGSVGAGFNVDNLMRGVLNRETAKYLRFRLYDEGSAAADTEAGSTDAEWLLFDSDQERHGSPVPPAKSDPDAFFRHVLPMTVGGRIWRVHFSAAKNAIIDRVDAVLPWATLAGGILSSTLLFGMFYSLSSSRSRAIGIAGEMTKDLRESERALKQSADQLQALSRRLVEVQESERRQFSRELHDRVGQNLTALSISVDILKTQVAGNGDAAVRSRLDDAAKLLESTTGVIENVMSELRPPMLDDYGLLPALQWYANEFSGRTGIGVTVHGDEGMERLPQASEIALFRIVQEALTNVAKHAQARQVDINVEHTGARFVMSVSDDGVGLDPAAASSAGRRQGLGMVTMRERTQAVGGQFEIGSAPGRGTRLVVRVPCQRPGTLK